MYVVLYCIVKYTCLAPPIVLRHALETEVGLVDPVTGIGGLGVLIEFKMQVKGIDFPSYEFSQFSEVATIDVKLGSSEDGGGTASMSRLLSRPNSIKSASSNEKSVESDSDLSDDEEDKKTAQVYYYT